MNVVKEIRVLDQNRVSEKLRNGNWRLTINITGQAFSIVLTEKQFNRYIRWLNGENLLEAYFSDLEISNKGSDE
jgi:hypothetical protein